VTFAVAVPKSLTWPAGLPIGDVWAPVDREREVVFPFDGTVVASAPLGSAALATAALDEAYAARGSVGRLSTGVRRAVLAEITERIASQREALTQLLVLETGKPWVDCAVEVARTILTWSLTSEEPARLHGETVPVDLSPGTEGLVGYFTRRPAGVVVGIAGFNYPLLLASHKIAPAIAAGCPVVAKPAPATPLATLWLVDQVRQALIGHDAPASGVQLVTGDTDVGVALTTDPRVAVVSFTGSAAVGHAIARACAPRRAVLELGSNAALVVAADADLGRAADAVLRGGFYASGQACISVQRVIVEEPVVDRFTAAVLERMPEVVVGDPRDPATRVSALIDAVATERVVRHIDAAVVAGARVLAGGGRSGAGLAPPVLADVPSGEPAWAEEIFGPVVAIRTVPDLTTAFALVNESRYGLHASVFTTSLATAHRAIDELEVGGVIVNEVPGFRSDAMPYGGVKDSGIGREGPRWAVEEFTVTRMAVIRP